MPADHAAAAASRIDVLVVGAGGSGLAAAIEAATAGARVLVLEKNAYLGGTTRLSVGSITATGTPHQRRAGVVDSVASHAADLALINGRRPVADNPELRRVLTEETPATFQWLLDLGVEFVGPLPEAPHSQPRMHCVLPTARAYIDRLERRARALGVQIRCGMRVTRLLLDGDRLTGVVAVGESGGEQTLLAGATVLASGDFSGNAAMVARHVGPAAARARPINPTNTGDGHQMAEAIGARILNGEVALLSVRFLPPTTPPLVQRLPPARWLARIMRLAYERLPAAWVRPFLMAFITSALQPVKAIYDAGAILVDREGRRFGDETNAMAETLVNADVAQAWLICDQRIVEQFSAWPHFVSTAPGTGYAYMQDYRRHRRDLWHSAATLPELGRRAGIAADTLASTVAAFNDGDAARRAGPLQQGPFVALGPLQPVLVFTDGGLQIDTAMRVCKDGNLPIPGLYAAGAVGQGGQLLDGHGHHIGWAFASGRLAGRNALAFSRAGVV